MKSYNLTLSDRPKGSKQENKKVLGVDGEGQYQPENKSQVIYTSAHPQCLTRRIFKKKTFFSSISMKDEA